MAPILPDRPLPVASARPLRGHRVRGFDGGPQPLTPAPRHAVGTATGRTERPMTESEFVELWSACAPRLVRAVYAITGDVGEAHDVVSEAFARAWARRRAFAQVDEPEAWLRTVAVRLAVSRWRKART